MRDMRKDPLWEELYQNLLKSGKNEGQQTGMAALGDVQEHWDKNGRIYQTDKNGNKISSTSNYIEKIGNKAKAVGTNVSNWINESNPEHKFYKEKANLIGALSNLPYGAGTAIAKSVTSKLTPHVGRKIAQSVADGLSGGAIAGTVEGALRSYQENQNPLKTIPQDAVTGAVSGLGLGALGSNIQKVVRGKQLKSFGDIDQLDNIARKQYQKSARSYYQDYIQGTNNNKNGQVDFTKRGIQEQLKWNPQQAQYLPELRNDFKYAKRLPDEPNKDINDKFYTDAFEIYRGNQGDHLVERFKDGSRRYYMTRNTPNGTPHATSTGSKGSVSNSIIPETSQTLKFFTKWLEELKRKRGH